MKIKRAERLTLNLPFYTRRVVRAMQRAQTHNERVYVYRVELDDGTIGYGDGGGDNIEHLAGQNPLALINDDSIGFGPQVAVLDAVGRATETPVHALLGVKLRSSCPVSWWDIDMPPADWAAEARESLKRGYTCIKLKARPWFDIVGQLEAVGKVVPADYKFDVDFNGFLLTQARAEVMLQILDEHPNVGMYESPFYMHRDVAGARILRERVRKPIVEHFQEMYLEAHCADGFVIGGGASSIRQAGTLAASFNKPFWLQLVGTGLTTAFASHMGSILSHAQLPYITCSELWQHDLLKKRLEVINGYVAVTDSPGLGVEVDERALKKYQVADGTPTPTDDYRSRKRILRISWPAIGRQKRIWEFSNEAAYQKEFYHGNIPGFERGVSLQVIEDDKSAGFRRDHSKITAAGR